MLSLIIVVYVSAQLLVLSVSEKKSYSTIVEVMYADYISNHSQAAESPENKIGNMEYVFDLMHKATLQDLHTNQNETSALNGNQYKTALVVNLETLQVELNTIIRTPNSETKNSTAGIIAELAEATDHLLRSIRSDTAVISMDIPKITITVTESRDQTD